MKHRVIAIDIHVRKLSTRCQKLADASHFLQREASKIQQGQPLVTSEELEANVSVSENIFLQGQPEGQKGIEWPALNTST